MCLNKVRIITCRGNNYNVYAYIFEQNYQTPVILKIFQVIEVFNHRLKLGQGVKKGTTNLDDHSKLVISRLYPNKKLQPLKSNKECSICP